MAIGDCLFSFVPRYPPVWTSPTDRLVILDVGGHVARYAALALVDGKPWDMHRPLPGNCQLKFLYFTDENPSLVNHVSTAVSLLVAVLQKSLFRHIGAHVASFSATSWRHRLRTRITCFCTAGPHRTVSRVELYNFVNESHFSFPVHTGSFVYDVRMDDSLLNWQPTAVRHLAMIGAARLLS